MLVQHDREEPRIAVGNDLVARCHRPQGSGFHYIEFGHGNLKAAPRYVTQKPTYRLSSGGMEGRKCDCRPTPSIGAPWPCS